MKDGLDSKPKWFLAPIPLVSKELAQNFPANNAHFVETNPMGINTTSGVASHRISLVEIYASDSGGYNTWIYPR